MNRLPRALCTLIVSTLLGVVGLAAAPSHASGIAFPVQCEVGRETVLAWDDVDYDLNGTCGVVRVTASNATVTMPAATRLILDGAGNTVTAKPLTDVVIVGAGNSVTTPSIHHLSITGAATTVAVGGLVERAELSSSASALSADTINVLRLRGADTVTARTTYRTRITGFDNVLHAARSDRLVLTGDRNTVTVARGRTTLRDRGQDNVLDLRRRRS